MTRKKRIINGFILKSIYMVLNVGIAFFMMPYILHTLGDRMYSVWILVGAFVGYSGYLDFGLSSAVGRFVSRGIGRNDMAEVNEIVNTSFLLYLVIGGLTLVMTFVVAWAAAFLISSPDELWIVRFLIFTLGFNAAVGFPTRAFGSVVGSNMRYEVTEGIELLSLLLRNALIVLLFGLGYRILSLGLVHLGVSLLSYGLYMFFAFYLVKGVRFDTKLFNRGRIRELFSYSSYTFVIKLSEMLIFRVDSVVIGFFVGLAVVAHYSIASTMVSYFLFFIYGIFSLAGPAFSQDEGRGDMDGVRHKFLLTTKIAVYITLFISSLTIFYGWHFINRWMGPAYVDAYPALVVLICGITVLLMQMPTSMVLFNISKHRFLAYLGVGEAVSNVALSLALVGRYGMVGVALGTAIPMVITRLAVLPLYACKTLEISRSRYYINILSVSTGVALIGLLPAYFYMADYVRSEYARLLILSAAHVAVYLPVVFFAGFDKAEKAYILGYFGKTLGRAAGKAEAV